MKKNLKTKSSSQVIVVSMMCTVLVTIVGQTVNVALNPGEYQSVQAAQQEPQVQKVHGVADNPSQTLLADELNAHVDKNKDKLNSRLKKMLGGGKGTNTSTEQVKTVEKNSGQQGFDYHREDPHTHNEGESSVKNQRDYVPFDTLQDNLKGKTCRYELPVDNADPPLREVIQWGLDRCLITVSGSYKVYPNDYLTHKMMRIIAERAGFSVKMEYASDKIVTNSELLSFLNALQQNHQISYIPSVPVGQKVTRGEYLTVLYRLFTNDTVWDRDVNVVTDTKQVSMTDSLQTQALSLGKELLNGTDKKDLNVPNELKNQLLDYANKTLSDTTSSTKNLDKEIGIDTDALQATRVQIQQWLGRS